MKSNNEIHFKLISLTRKYIFKHYNNAKDLCMLKLNYKKNLTCPFSSSFANIIYKNLLVGYQNKKSAEEMFLSFLNDNDCKDIFLAEFEHFKADIINLHRYCTVTRIGSFLSSAFSWNASKYGSSFWYELSIKWNDSLIKYL